MPTERLAQSSGWRVVRLGDVLSEADARARADGMITAPVLSLTKNFGLIPQSERFEHRVARADVSDYKVVKRGWLVYNPYVIWEGAIHVLRNREVGLVSPVYVVFTVVPDVDPEFLDLIIRSSRMLAAFSQLSSGVVQRRRSIKKTGFLSIEIGLPSYQEQQRIARALGTAEIALRSSERVLSSTRSFTQSLMTHLFTFGPISPAQAGTARTIESAAGLIPEHWSVEPISAGLRNAQYGLSQRGEATGRIPMFRMNSIRGGRMRLDDLQHVDIDDGTLDKFRLRPGDVLFNRTNSYDLVGKTALFEHPGQFVFASYLVRLQTEPSKLTPEFLNYYLNWDVAQLRMRALASRGVSQSNINATKLKAFEIPFPPLDEQRSIVRMLDAVEVKARAEDQRRNASRRLFSSLQAVLTTDSATGSAING